MKQPNSYGSVHKLPGKRRRPWRVRKTSGWIFDENNERVKQQYITIGYFATKQEALQALANYNENPYDIATNSITFSEVYERWSKEHFETIVPSAQRTWKSAYNHSKPLWEMRMKDIRPAHMEGTIRDAQIGADTKNRMKSLYNLMFKYALKHEIVDKDYAVLCNGVKKEEPDRIRKPFSENEIQILWDNIDIPFVDIILIGIYSGWRPQELATLKTEDIDLENGTMRGGMKTDAGKNRYVPIHSKIRPLVEKWYDSNRKQLFYDDNGKNGSEMDYGMYYTRFKEIMSRLNMDHIPHEVRHTFITLAKEADMNEYCLKLIIGHDVNDVTERVYTHRTLESLRTEIEKIK